MQYTRLTRTSDIRALLRSFGKEGCVLDLETDGLDQHQNHIEAVVLGRPGSEEAYYLSAEHVPLLSSLAEDVLLIGQNIKFDITMLFRAGVNFLGRPFRDTMLMHHLLDETAEHGLDAMVKREYQDAYKEQFWLKYKEFTDAPPDEQLSYACRDVIYTGRLYRLFESRLRSEQIPEQLIHYTHELARALLRTEIGGVPVDLNYLVTKGQELKIKIDEYLPKMRALVDTPCRLIELRRWDVELEKRVTLRGKGNVPCPEFSFDSNKDLVALLYNELQLPVQKHHKTKQITTDDEALTKLAEKHPVVPLLQEYRGWNKVYTSYIIGTQERLVDGYIYPSFSVNGTKTGRISHSNPNLGQLPKEGGVKGIYLASPGYKIVSADYRQLEVMLLAHFSGDKALIQIIEDGTSQHDVTAAALDIPRHKAKTLNFAMAYRCSPFKVAKLLECSQPRAQELWKRYWDTYSGVKALMDECDQKVDAGEPIVTPYGRKRRFPLEFEMDWHREKAKRQAFNFLVQSTGADTTNRAFVNVSQKLLGYGAGRALWTVHDSILIEAPEKYVDGAQELLERCMVESNRTHKWRIPLSVEIEPPADRWIK